MEERTRKGWAPILAALLVLAVVVGLIPQTGTTAYAANGDPAMSLGATALDLNVNTSNAQTVRYADKAWRVIGYNGKYGTAVSRSGAATLLAAGNLAQTKYNADGSDSKNYANSSLKAEIDTIAGSFSAGEQGAIVKRELRSGSYSNGYTDCIVGEALNDIPLWPLSTWELGAVPRDLRQADPNNPDSDSSYWWLRSPGKLWIERVDGYGYYGSMSTDYKYSYGVRPAFYLNLESVLFTSAAEGGKSSGAEGADALKAQSDQTNSGDEWKVTLQSEHAGFEISECSLTENGVAFKYWNATLGTEDTPEYISAIITDKPITDSSAKITYYGRIQECTSESGAVAINTQGKLGENDYLYVFNEQYNGNKKTDYASALQEFKILVPVSYDVTFKVANGSWDDGTTEDKTVTLSGYKGDTLKLEAGQIPAAGSMPDENYGAGSWNVEPSAETAISADTTYTYTYRPKLTITANDLTYEYNGRFQGPGDAAYKDPADIAEMVTVVGLEDGDALTSITVDGQAKDVGAHEDALVPYGATVNGTSASDKYDVTYVAGTLTIEPAIYAVTFVDGQGNTLKTEKVESGKAATAPADPKRSGYVFAGWDKDFGKVTGDMTVTAKWKKEPAVSGTLLSKITAKGSNALVLKWSKVKGAEGYDIFFSPCGKDKKCRKAKTVKGNKALKWTKGGLDAKRPYKAIVRAYVKENGEKSYVRASSTVHAYTSGGTGKYTNSKGVTVKKASVSLKAGETCKIKASVTKLDKGKKLMPSGHAPRLRYVSSNKKVATVSRSGKVTAKGKGGCKVYAIAVNGARKAVSVTVK